VGASASPQAPADPAAGGGSFRTILAYARRHSTSQIVALLERDSVKPEGPAEAAPGGWQRKGLLFVAWAAVVVAA
jgi:hypothetical protein